MAPTPARLIAALADRYRIERELGQGGMATVYLAEDLKHRRKVAVKVLKPELAAVLGAERFVVEITTTAALQHPHILPLFDSGEADGFLYYVMPFIDGETLRAKLDRETQLGVDEAVRIASDVASALHYAHTHGVIHRDIKPENILLHDGRPMVADFGIALAVSAAAGGRMTETGLSLGTPHYMSPEQATAEKEITGRSDEYSLASVLYEMLTGDPPHTGSSAQQIIMRIITEQPAAVTQFRRSVPPNVAAAVAKALEKLPADRFASAREFAEALANPAFGAATRASQAGPTSHDGSRLAARPLLALATGVAVVTLVLAAVGWMRALAPRGVSRFVVTLSRARFENSVVSAGQNLIEHQASLSPDGSLIAFTDSIGERVQLMLKRRADDQSEPLAGTDGGHAPIFSPDGRWIAYFTEDGRIRKLPTGGGGSTDIARDANRFYFVATWLDDGTIVYVDATGGLRRVSSDGGPSRVLATVEAIGGRDVSTMSPLPGARGVLITSCPGNCAGDPLVGVFDLTADTLRVLVPDAVGAWYVPSGQLLYTLVSGGLYAVRFDLKRLTVTGGARSVIPDVGPGEFSISATGAVLYTTGDRSARLADLVWVSRSGAVEPADSGWRADFQYPALSPDGRAIAVSVTEEETQVWVRRADGVRQRLTSGGSYNWRPAWSADGRSIIYSSLGPVVNEEVAARDLFEVAADGSGAPRLVADAEEGIWELDQSRDGRWMTYRTDNAGGTVSRVWARRNGGDSTTLSIIDGPGVRRQIAVSPDSRWLAYTSDESGRAELYVVSFPDAAVKRLISQGGGTEPRWSASGRELFFKSRGSLMVVAIPSGATLSPGVPRPLFPVAGYRSAQNRQQYDVSPDGQRFLMIRQPDGGGLRRLVYAENWLEELSTKVPQ